MFKFVLMTVLFLACTATASAVILIGPGQYKPITDVDSHWQKHRHHTPEPYQIEELITPHGVRRSTLSELENITTTIARELLVHKVEVDPDMDNGAAFFNSAIVRQIQDAGFIVDASGFIEPSWAMDDTETYYHQLRNLTQQHLNESGRSIRNVVHQAYLWLWYSSHYDDYCTALASRLPPGVNYGYFSEGYCFSSPSTSTYTKAEEIGSLSPIDQSQLWYESCGVAGWMKLMTSSWCVKRSEYCMADDHECLGTGGSECGPSVSGGYGNWWAWDLGYSMSHPTCHAEQFSTCYSQIQTPEVWCNCVGGKPYYRSYKTHSQTARKDHCTSIQNRCGNRPGFAEGIIVGYQCISWHGPF